MTITNTDRVALYTGNGSTTEWPYPFRIPDADAVLLETIEISTGTLTAVPSTDYSITGLDDPEGGTLTYPTSGSPLAATHMLQITRNTVPLQERSVSNQRRYDASVVERVWDYLTMTSQDLRGDLNRGFRVTGRTTPLNPVVPVADTLVGFDSEVDMTLYPITNFTGANAILRTPVQLTGDGTTTAFTLPYEVLGPNSVTVSVGGLDQISAEDYNASGNLLTFSEPPADEAQIQVRVAVASTAQENPPGLAIAREFGTVSEFKISSLGYRNFSQGQYLRIVEPYAIYEVAPSTATDHDLVNLGGLRVYVLPETQGINIEACGAALNGTTDDSAAISVAAGAARRLGVGLTAPKGRVTHIENPVDLTGIKYIDFQSVISVDPAISEVPVTIGGLANVIGARWVFRRVTDGSSFLTGTPPSRPILRVFGSKAAYFELGSCQYVQFYADVATPTGSSNAYNNVYFHGTVFQLELTGTPGVSWNNENFFYGGRIKKLIVDGTNYPHNHNKWFNPTMEGADVDIQFLGDAHVNTIYGARFEGADASSGVTFGAGTYSNYVIASWSGVGNPRNQFYVDIPVSDSGQGNAVFTEAAYYFDKTDLFSVGASNVILGTATSGFIDEPWSNQPFGAFTGQQRIIPELAGFTYLFGTRYLAATDYVPVGLGDVITQEADYDGNLTRLHIYVFDENMDPITSEGGGDAYVSSPGYTLSTSNGFGYYARGSDAAAAGLSPISVVRPEVKFIKIGLYAPTTGLIRNYTVSLRTPPNRRPLQKGFGRARTTHGVLDGTPTRGFAPLDYMIFETTGGTWLRCAYVHETQVSGALTAGATSMTVVGAGAIANGDIVGVMLDDETTHWTSVSALVGSTFTIDAVPAGRAVADGARVVFNRWA